VWDGYVNLTKRVSQQIRHRPENKKARRDIFISGLAFAIINNL
jgi:hypothetical protein